MRTFLIGIWVIVAVASLAFGAQSPIKPAQLVGSWRFEDARGGACILRFVADGTFNGYFEQNRKPGPKFSGTWSCDSNRIFYVYSAPVRGAKDVDEILSITEESFVIRNQSREVHRYVRIVEG